MNCFCGCSTYKTETRPGFITDKHGGSVEQEIPVGVCDCCGMIRQIDLPFSTEEDYGRYYSEKYPPVTSEYDPKDYKGDLAEAGKTYDRFKLAGSKRFLDLGCGSGALVEYCRSKRIEAYGCELGRYHYAPANPFIYYRKFEEINFPTDHFDRLVCADVVEHVLDPIQFLKEIFRVTAQNGTCFIEIPLFFHETDSAGHWKRIEHIWYFTVEQFEKTLRRVGFTSIETMNKPGAKIVFTVKKPEQTRIKLLLPPGVGDAYWTLIKMEAFFKREGINPPVDAYVACPRAKKHDSHARVFPFLSMFPFLNSTGEVRFNPRDPVWKEAYLQQGRSIFENVQGCDYFITWNGHQRAGKDLNKDIEPGLKCNWHLPRFVSLVEEQYRTASIAKYGDYLVLYWSFQGTGRTLFRHISLEQIAASIGAIIKATGLTPVLVGAVWDMDDVELEKLRHLLPKNTIDLRGKTTIEEVFGLMRGAKAVVGMNSGITIMAGVFGVKTILLYHEYLFTGSVHRDFAWHTFPPDVRKKTYFAEFADTVTGEGFAARAISVINDTPHVKKKENIRPVGLPPRELPKEVTRGGHVSIRRMEPRGSAHDTTIACVLKTGGDFDERYVVNLKRALDRNLTHPFKFVCLTDDPAIKGVDTIRLTNGHPGWWSKIELFQPGAMSTERVLYFDLDTLILANIDDLLELGGSFYGLSPWNFWNRQAGQCASGIMSWKNGDYDFLYNEFNGPKIQKQGDQVYISAALKAHGGSFTAFQDVAPGIYSYKRECRRSGPPRDARIVCFHGRPRVHEVRDAWVKEAWG
jgi:SAM-dependent methyltransferase